VFSVSYTAGELLALMLAQAEAPDDTVIRLVAGDGSLGLEMNTVQPGDTTFAHAEKIVLAIDEQISEMLSDQKLDVKLIGEEPELVLIERFEGDEGDD